MDITADNEYQEQRQRLFTFSFCRNEKLYNTSLQKNQLTHSFNKHSKQPPGSKASSKRREQIPLQWHVSTNWFRLWEEIYRPDT